MPFEGCHIASTAGYKGSQEACRIVQLGYGERRRLLKLYFFGYQLNIKKVFRDIYIYKVESPGRYPACPGQESLATIEPTSARLADMTLLTSYEIEW